MSAPRLLSRLVGFLWALVLAGLVLGIALYCLDGLVSLGSARPDRLLHLPTARRETGRFLAQLEAPGGVATLSLLCGIAGVIVGLLLLKGVFTRPRERLAVLEEDPAGTLTARRRALARMLHALASDTSDVWQVSRVKLSLRRRGVGGRVRLSAVYAGDSDEATVKRAVEQALDPLATPFKLKSRVSTRRLGGKRAGAS